MSSQPDDPPPSSSRSSSTQHSLPPSATSPSTSSVLDTSITPESSRLENDHAVVSKSGTLDLSHLGISSLSQKFAEDYARVHKLDVSHNAFHQISRLDRFVECVEIVASHNLLSKLSSFLPLTRHLYHLDVSHNHLTNVEHLPSFNKLKTVILSKNSIESLPLLSLTSLVVCDLSSNRLSELPDLSHLPNLEMLNLSGNQISSLEHAEHRLPHGLKDFHIGENALSDLSDCMHLSVLSSLQSIAIVGNPCVVGSVGLYSYRPYLFCVISGEFGGSLNEVDGFVLNEEEKLKGESLFVQGKVRRFKLGHHQELVDYLEKQCPFEATKLHTKHERNLQRVLEKRREYLSQSGNESDISCVSVHSPYSNWKQQRQEGKENCAPLSPSSISTPNSSRIPSSQPFSPSAPLPSHRLSRSDTAESLASNSTVVLSRRTVLSGSGQSTTREPASPVKIPELSIEPPKPRPRHRSRQSRVVAVRRATNEQTTNYVTTLHQNTNYPMSTRPQSAPDALNTTVVHQATNYVQTTEYTETTNGTTSEMVTSEVEITVEDVLPEGRALSEVPPEVMKSRSDMDRSSERGEGKRESAERRETVEKRENSEMREIEETVEIREDEENGGKIMGISRLNLEELDTESPETLLNTTFICPRRDIEKKEEGGEEPDSFTSRRLDLLENTVIEMSRQNENLTEINIVLADTIAAMKEKFEAQLSHLSQSLARLSSLPPPHSLVPVPQCLVTSSPEDGAVKVNWVMPSVKNYQVYVDSQPIGQVRGLHREANITDLCPGEHVIQLAAVALDGTEGEKSEPVKVVV